MDGRDHEQAAEWPARNRYKSREQEPMKLGESAMDEDHLNMEIRKFLKKVGVTSQREIEKAVKGALDTEKLSGKETLNARMRLQIDEIDLDLTIEGDIGLA